MFYQDYIKPEFITAQEGVTLWLRHVVWLDGPNKGRRGYVPAIRIPGIERTGEITYNRIIALEEATAEFNAMILELRDSARLS